MDLTGKKNLKSRMSAFLMAFLMVFAMSSMSIMPAFAADASGDTGDPGGAGGPASIFDIVGDDGKVGEVSGGGEGGFTVVITQYRTIAVAITGILTITMLIFMLIRFTKLGASGDNEMARKKAIMGILTTGIATALLGGATIIVGFFWNVLTSTPT